MSQRPSIQGQRQTQTGVDPLFVERFSTRAFAPNPLPEEDLQTIFEAARWAPSSFNEQPWLILYAHAPEQLERARPILSETNRVWADRAPVLGVFFARQRLARNGKPNGKAHFDTGAAWMSVALQTRLLGYEIHPMGGFSSEKAFEVFGVPAEEYDAIAAFVIGRYGDPAELPEEVREREKPSGRKPLSEVAMAGAYRAT